MIITYRWSADTSHTLIDENLMHWQKQSKNQKVEIITTVQVCIPAQALKKNSTEE
jgi:hypothetical protein